MTSLLRRVTVTVVAVLVIALGAIGLVEAGVQIGAAGPRSNTIGAAPADASTAAAAAPAAATTDGADPSDGDLAAGIDSLLAVDQTATAAPSTAGKVRINAAVQGLRRLAAARKLVHATVLLDLPNLGGLTTVQLDHGTISAVSGSSLSVKEANNATVTVQLGGQTRVRRNAAKAAIADLKTGDEAFVMSKVDSDGTEAYLVVVPAV